MGLTCIARLIHLNHILRLSLLPDELILPVLEEICNMNMRIDSIYIRPNTPSSIIDSIRRIYPDAHIEYTDEISTIDTSLYMI